MSKKLKKRLLLRLYGGNYILIKLSELIYCQADGNYTYYYMKDGKRHIASKNIKMTQEVLHKESFYRVHQSLIINLNHLKHYNRTNRQIVLQDDIIFPVSVRNEATFHKYLSKRHYTLT